MPKVPTYDTPQEQARPLPGVRQESVASPALMADAATGGLGAFSKGLLDAGVGASAVSYYMADRENATAVLSVETARKEKWITFETDAQKNRQGANAKGLAKDTKDWWDKAAQEDFSALGNDAQRELYKRRMSPQAIQSLSVMSRFQNHQENVALGKATDAAVVAATNSAAASPTEENVRSEER